MRIKNGCEGKEKKKVNVEMNEGLIMEKKKEKDGWKIEKKKGEYENG